MNCPMCAEEMETHTDNADYQALPGAILKGVRLNECPNCGEREVEIPRIEELNRVLAKVLIYQTTRLTGPQVRFLRKHLDVSHADFAHKMGVNPPTVGIWEAGAFNISTSNDRLLRMIVAYEDSVEDFTDQLVEVAREVAGQEPPEIDVCGVEQRWQVV